jgi:DNA-binding NtrC family response regulator
VFPRVGAIGRWSAHLRYALLITPDRTTRAQLTDLLESLDVAVDHVEAGCEAVELLGEYTYDYVVSDQKLADLGALDLLLHMKAGEDTTFIVIAPDEAAVRMLAEAAPATVRPIAKPIQPAQMHRLLQEGYVDPCPSDGDSCEAAKPAKPRRRSKRGTLGQMLGNCGPMTQVYEMIARVAPTNASVLLIGPSGTGKELVARAIHERGERADKPFIAINCGAIPATLIESELFGHEKGAFTSADSQRIGVFERAHGGTLFLDEITEMGVEMQARLLRVLETGRYQRVGGEQELAADVRLITATNRSPAEAVREGVFREDLLYRISVFPIQLPPLRDRGDDVILLANHFLAALNQSSQTDKQLTKNAEKRLRTYAWPGNVRQLRNMVERAYILEDDDIDMTCLVPLLNGGDEAGSTASAITPAMSVVSEPAKDGKKPAKSSAAIPEEPDGVMPAGASGAMSVQPASDRDDEGVVVVVGTTIEEAERQLILRTLAEYGGDKKKAAEVLGISLKTLYNRLNAYAERDSQTAQLPAE